MTSKSKSKPGFFKNLNPEFPAPPKDQFSIEEITWSESLSREFAIAMKKRLGHPVKIKRGGCIDPDDFATMVKNGIPPQKIQSTIRVFSTSLARLGWIRTSKQFMQNWRLIQGLIHPKSRIHNLDQNLQVHQDRLGTAGYWILLQSLDTWMTGIAERFPRWVNDGDEMKILYDHLMPLWTLRGAVFGEMFSTWIESNLWEEFGGGWKSFTPSDGVMWKKWISHLLRTGGLPLAWEGELR